MQNISYLGIDYGLAHVGIALAQSAIAQPLKTLPNNQRLFEELKQIIKEFAIKKIIIGHSTGKMSDPIKDFGAKINSNLEIEVIYVDETLTTKEVQKKIAHASKKKRQQLDHQFAAAQILQDYLDFN